MGIKKAGVINFYSYRDEVKDSVLKLPKLRFLRRYPAINKFLESSANFRCVQKLLRYKILNITGIYTCVNAEIFSNE